MEQVEQQHQHATKQLRPDRAEQTEQQPRPPKELEVANTQRAVRKSSRPERRKPETTPGKPASTTMADTATDLQRAEKVLAIDGRAHRSTGKQTMRATEKYIPAPQSLSPKEGPAEVAHAEIALPRPDQL
eukprot:4790790-Amphidinium_carterae.1